MDRKSRTDNRQNWHHTEDLHAPQGKGDPFAAAMRSTRMAMIITDPTKQDNPIVFANDAFLKLTGYDRDEVIGRNCRFLQGAETDPSDVSAIRDAVANESDIAIDILNYRRNGETFWNALYLSPVSDDAGQLLYFFASQLDVTASRHLQSKLNSDKDWFEQAVKDRTRALEQALETQRALLHEVDHRVKNNLQLVASLINMQVRSSDHLDAKTSLQAVGDRIAALSAVHKLLYLNQDVQHLGIRDLMKDLAEGFKSWGPSSSQVSICLDIDDVSVPASVATPVALIVNELLTNAFKHAFPEGKVGNIKIAGKRNDLGIVMTITDDGTGYDRRNKGSGFGTRLTELLARQIGTRLEWMEGDRGTGFRFQVSIATDALRNADIR